MRHARGCVNADDYQWRIGTFPPVLDGGDYVQIAEPDSSPRRGGPRYTQHNPDAQDGPEAFIGFVHYLRGENPDLTLDIKRVIAEGDMVVTHSHLVLKPGERGRALADLFRLEDGKIVEHWDVIQEVPESAANANGMF